VGVELLVLEWVFGQLLLLVRCQISLATLDLEWRFDISITILATMHLLV
jgi:hypothetical protein